MSNFVSLAFSPLPLSLLLILSPLILYFINSNFNIHPHHPIKINDGILGRIGIPLSFFRNRFNFILAATKVDSLVSISITGRKVILMSHTKDNLDVFFGNKGLSLDEGVGIVLGGQPSHEAGGPTFSEKFHRKMMFCMKKEKLRALLPTLMEAASSKYDGFEENGIMNPFDISSVYGLIYQLTVYIFGAVELAKNSQLLKKSLQCVETIEGSVTDCNTLFPWLPLPSKLKRLIAGGRFYFMVSKIVKERAGSGRVEEDLLQEMIDSNESLQTMTTVIIAGLFAGAINTTINGAYILAYLGKSPNDRTRAIEEIKRIAAKYSLDDSISLAEKLKSVPLEAWEKEFTFLDACLNESIRLNLLGLAWRKNITKDDIKVGEKVIPAGAYVAAAFSDCHTNPDIYPEPLKFNPSRWDQKSESKLNYDFIGWGRLLHPCLGMKVAKLEIFLVVATFLARFEYEVTDIHGEEIELPVADLNLHNTKKGVGIYLKYRAVAL